MEGENDEKEVKEARLVELEKLSHTGCSSDEEWKGLCLEARQWKEGRKTKLAEADVSKSDPRTGRRGCAAPALEFVAAGRAGIARGGVAQGAHGKE